MIRTGESITFEHQEFTAPNTQRFPSILQSDTQSGQRGVGWVLQGFERVLEEHTK
jgi:hypothetical protein